MKKTIISSAIGIGMLLAAAVPTFATNVCDNLTTGAYSLNYCTILAKKKARIKIYNTGNVVNNVTSNSTTGNNNQNQNTQGGLFGILTGNASATSNPVVTDLNTTNVTVNQTCDECTAGQGSNELTGANSTNNVTIDLRKRIKVRIENIGNVVNNIDSYANSGTNNQNQNTIAGDIVTGDATSSSGVSTSVNVSTVNITQ